MKLNNIFACFRHNTNEENTHSGSTDCILKIKDKKDNIEVIGKGHSSVHCSDTYVKATGRKISLRRALKDAKLNKEERTEAWSAYFNNVAEGIAVV